MKKVLTIIGNILITIILIVFFLWVISCGMGLIDCNDQIAEPVECVCFPDNFEEK